MKINRQEIYSLLDGLCAYCGCRIEFNNFQIDHLQPKYRGGNNKLSNLLPSCRSCNASKATYTLEEFRQRLKEDIQRLRRDSSKFRLLEKFDLIRETDKKIIFYFETLLEEDQYLCNKCKSTHFLEK